MVRNETNPLVSVLVPVYNAESYIERCVRSILEQTYEQIECIFVDDGCSDSSIAILENVIAEYSCRKEKCTIIHNHENKGLAAARNTAVSSCHGDFIFHIDADDWIEPNTIADLVKKQQATGADIVYTSGYYKHIGNEDIIIDCDGWSTDKKTLLLNILQDKATICVWSKLIRMKLYTDYDIRCDEKGSFYEDYQVLPRLIYYSKIIECLDGYKYHYNRSNPKSLVTNLTKSLEIQKQGLLSVQTTLDFFNGKEQCYFDLAYSFYLYYTYKIANVNYHARNKEGYLFFINILKQTERRYWNLIGWNNSWRRMKDQLYYLYLLKLLYYKIIHLKSRLARPH